MYIGYKEVQQGKKVIFYLQGAFGGEVEAARGQLLPSSGTANGNEIIEYSGSHPAARPITTQSKEDIIKWIQDIIQSSNKTMQQQPVSPTGQKNGTKTKTPATTAAPRPSPKEQKDIQMTENNNTDDSDKTLSDPGTEILEEKRQNNKRKPSTLVKAATAANKAPSSIFHFVSYREEFRGLSETGHPPRRMWHWLLKDAQGHEHVAVDTTKWEQGKKRFTYSAVQPFSQVKPLVCYNRRSVIEYMNQFVPPAARHAVPAEAMGGSKFSPSSGAGEGGSKDPTSKVKAKSSTGTYDLQPGKGKKLSAAALKKKQQQLRDLVVDPGAFITNTAKRNEARTQHMDTINKQLDLLRAECGVQYSLTLVGSDGSMEVLTSKEKRPSAATAADKPDAAILERAYNSIISFEIGSAGGSGAPKKQKQQSVEEKAIDPATGADAANHQNKKQKRDNDDVDGEGNAGNNAMIIDSSNAAMVPAAEEQPPPVPPTQKRSRRNAPEDPDVAALFESMKTNSKIYLTGKWIREPLPPHPLQEALETFQVAEDCGEEKDCNTLLNKLSVDIPNVTAAGPGATSDPPKESDILVVVDSLPEPVSGNEVELQPVWGIDAYTRHLLLDALKCCPQMSDEDSRDHFIDVQLLPALNGLGDDGWDIQKALTKIEKKSTASGDIRSAAGRVRAAFERLEEYCNDGKPVNPEARKHVRAHPKGEGVVVTAARGIAAGTFLGQYVGELYTAWRWAEREVKRRVTGTSGVDGVAGVPGGAIAARKAATRMGASSEYYNIVLERPKSDPRGYDVMYVDAVQKGNFVSRLSHSCNPNCRSVTVVVAGRLTLGVWTTRDVAVGEELTVDFAGETDLEREGNAAVCLCGSAACRGTFLYVTPGVNSPLNAVVAAKLTMPDRCGMILEAVANPNLSFEDNERLAKYGFKELMLYDGLSTSPENSNKNNAPTSNGGSSSNSAEEIPAWLMKWLALSLKFVEDEAVELQTLLTTAPSPTSGSGAGGGDALPYTEEETADEIDHLVSGRIHSLAVALDRSKMFLRHQSDELKATAPLRMLSDSEVAQHLWSGNASVARRVVGALSSYAKQKASIRSAVGRRGSARRVKGRYQQWNGGYGRGKSTVKTEDEDETEQEGDGDAEDKTTENTPVPSSTLNKNKKKNNNNDEEDGDETGAQNSSADILKIAAKIEEMLEEIEAPTADAARIALRRVAALLLNSGPSHLAMHDMLQMYAGTRNFMTFTQYTAFSSTLANGNEGSKYRQIFLWGLLTNWHRSSDPVDTLIADRRGCVCLPDVESCYMPCFADGKYAAPGGERSILLRTIWENPRAGWPKNCVWNFTFRHNQKVFGSPQLDVALREDGEVACRGLVEILQAVAK